MWPTKEMLTMWYTKEKLSMWSTKAKYVTYKRGLANITASIDI